MDKHQCTHHFINFEHLICGKSMNNFNYIHFQGLLTGTVLSQIVVCGLIVNTQYHISEGLFHHHPIPTSIDGCSNETTFFIEKS